MRWLFMVVAMSVFNCTRPKLVVAVCDEDLGYSSNRRHLANVRFLDEDKQIDWFELYDNLDERRKNRAPVKCIPGGESKSIEQQIERNEYDLKNLR